MIVLAFAADVAVAQNVDEPADKQPAAEATAQPAAQADATAVAVADTTDEAKKEKEWSPPNGYRVKVRDGETVYCRKQQVLGTRFPEEFCFTRAKLEDLEQRRRSIQNDVAQRQQMCTTGTACGG